MRQLATESTVLHVLDYSESSRIVRLATRDAGVVSVLARGARRPKSRFGSALDLFSDGVAHLLLKDGRDLHTLAAFELTQGRATLGRDLERFTGASTVAELVLRFATDDPGPELYATIVDALDALAGAPDAYARTAALSGAWRVLATLGFAPALDQCARCHAGLDAARETAFAHDAGGALCDRCAARGVAARRFPASARASLAAWLDGAPVPPLPDAEARAHQRLLREFVRHHLEDGRPLRAFAVWEHGEWGARAPERA